MSARPVLVVGAVLLVVAVLAAVLVGGGSDPGRTTPAVDQPQAKVFAGFASPAEVRKGNQARERLPPAKRARAVIAAVPAAAARPARSPDPQGDELYSNSPSAEEATGILRPCDQARGFTVYTLGERFEDLPASDLNAVCQPPPKVKGGRVAGLTRSNSTDVMYGLCRGAGENGCGWPVSVSNAPSCELPYALYRVYAGPEGERSPPPKLERMRGVPASRFDDRVELWTRDTAIVLFVEEPRQEAAVAALQSADGTIAPGDPLPRPASAIVGNDLSKIACSS
jgi:hypothetical protein